MLGGGGGDVAEGVDDRLDGGGAVRVTVGRIVLVARQKGYHNLALDLVRVGRVGLGQIQPLVCENGTQDIHQPLQTHSDNTADTERCPMLREFSFKKKNYLYSFSNVSNWHALQSILLI